MNDTARLGLRAEHRRIAQEIVAAHLPPETRVWVFGSRATGRTRPYSDVGLAIDAARPLTIDEAAILGEAFSDSDLPFRVDIVDWHGIAADFRALIAADRVPLK